MSDQVKKIISHIIKEEGGFSDHAADKGGRTNFGITSQSWEEYQSRHKLEETDISEITRSQAFSFYEERFYNKNIDLLPEELQLPVFDFEVNAGKYAITTLQQVLNTFNDATINPTLSVDGVLGEKTATDARHFCRDFEDGYVVDYFILSRIYYYKGLVDRNPSQSVFLNGWIARSERLFSWRQRK